jgi:PBSX family phage terminase large subunit
MPDGYWTPNFTAKNGKTHKKQILIFNSRKRFLLVCGGRRTGKTIGVLHRVMRHLWETPGARVALITKTAKVGKEGGVWSDLIEMAVPEWINSNMVGKDLLPLEYVSESKGVPGPRTDAATRTSTFRIRNWFGGESELIHLSLDNVAEVEAKFKGTRYSMIWFSELSEFDSMNVFTATIQSLRIGENQDQQFIADTNPAVDGTESWIYQTWYVTSRQKEAPEKFVQGVINVDKMLLSEDPTYKTRDPQTEWENYKSQFETIEVLLEDNPFLSRNELNELVGSNVDLNPGDYDRNVLGKWSKGFGHRGKLFSDVIIESQHFIAPAIDIDPTTFKLLCGWDLGGVNNAFVILEEKLIEDKPVWCVIDEVVTIDEKIQTEQFTFLCMDKMVKLEQFYKKAFEWFHWSDDTALNMYRPGSQDGYDAAIVKRVSNELIELHAADKPKESVETGVRIIRRMIRENRLYVGNNCPNTQAMLLNISEGKTKTVDDSPYKHPFDALRYPIYMETRKREATMTSKPNPSERSSMMSFG